MRFKLNWTPQYSPLTGDDHPRPGDQPSDIHGDRARAMVQWTTVPLMFDWKHQTRYLGNHYFSSSLSIWSINVLYCRFYSFKAAPFGVSWCRTTRSPWQNLRNPISFWAAMCSWVRWIFGGVPGRVGWCPLDFFCAALLHIEVKLWLIHS